LKQASASKTKKRKTKLRQKTTSELTIPTENILSDDEGQTATDDLTSEISEPSSHSLQPRKELTSKVNFRVP